MKKRLLLLFVLILLFKAASSQDSAGIRFRDLTYEEALKEAARENKMVFLHGYAEWCHFCHDMIEKVYPDSAVGAFYNSNFVCIKMDLEKEGKKLNERLLSHTFPTLVFFDSKGNIMHRAAGRHMKPMLLELGKEALDPRRRLYTWQQLFNEGNCSADTAYVYLRKMESTATNFQPEALKYLNKLPESALKEEKNWKIIRDLYKDVDAPFTTKLIRMKPELDRVYTKEVVDKKFFDMYKMELGIRIRTLDTIGYNRIIKQLSDSGPDNSAMIIEYAALMRSKLKGDYDKYFLLAEPFAAKYAMHDAALLNEIAQTFFERTKDVALLTKAADWARKSVVLNDIYNYNETLAGILILTGKKKEAMAVSQHAIDIGTSSKQNVQKARVYLEKAQELPEEK